MKRYLILLLIIAFTISMVFMGISCKEKLLEEEEVPIVADDSFPFWSPDGKMIAFESDRDDNWEIYIMKANGSGQTNLTNNPADDFVPSWSPDGKKIAFTSDRDGNREIYIMNADGSGLTNLTNNPTTDGNPS